MKSRSTPLKKKASARAPAKKSPGPLPKKPAALAKKAARETWALRLYVAGQTPKSLTAFANLKRMCDEHLPGRYKIEIIDLLQQPQLAQADQIVALPTLVRKRPEPARRVVGDLSNTERVLGRIDLKPRPNG